MKLVKITLALVLFLMVFVLLPAIPQAEIEAQMQRVLERQREAFSSGRSIFGMAQKSNVRTSDVVDEIIFQYNDSFGPEEVWENDYRSKFFYGDDGRLETMIDFYWDWDEEDWLPEPMVTSFYWHENGLLDRVKYRIYLSHIGDWLDYMIITQHYNPNNQILYLLMEVYIFEMEDWMDAMNIEFEYEQGRLSTILFTEFFDPYPRRQTYMNRSKIWYDANGRVSEILDEELVDEVWEPYAKVEYTYHQNDNSTYELMQDFINNFGAMFAYGWYFMDHPFGKFVEELEYSWDGQNFYEDYRTIMFYNANFLLERAEYQEYYDDEWSSWNMELLFYNEEQQLSERIYKWNEDDEWISAGRMLYFYKEVSNVEEVTLNPQIISAANYPNPFNPETTIVFNLPADMQVSLDVYNAKGQLVKNLTSDSFRAGQHQVIWNGIDKDGNSVSSGLYFYRIITDDSTLTGKMMLLK